MFYVVFISTACHYFLFQTFLPLSNPVEVKPGDYLVRYFGVFLVLSFDGNTSVKLGNYLLF